MIAKLFNIARIYNGDTLADLGERWEVDRTYLHHICNPKRAEKSARYVNLITEYTVDTFADLALNLSLRRKDEMSEFRTQLIHSIEQEWKKMGKMA